MQPHPPPPRLLPGQIEQTLAEHDELIALVAQLEAAEAPARARAICLELKTALRPHFTEEEQVDGVFDWLVALDPSCGPQLRELEQEHQDIWLLLQHVLGGDDSGVLQASRILAARIRSHECREVRLLERILSQN